MRAKESAAPGLALSDVAYSLNHWMKKASPHWQTIHCHCAYLQEQLHSTPELPGEFTEPND